MKKALFCVLLALATPFFVLGQFCSWEDDEFDPAIFPNTCIADFEVGENFFIFKGTVYTGNEVTEVKWWLTEYVCCDGISGDIIDPGETFITDQKVFKFSEMLVDYGDVAYSYRLHILATNLETGVADSSVFNYVNPYAYPPSVEAQFEYGEDACDLYIQMEMEAGLSPASFGIQIWTSTGDTLANHTISPANPDYESGLEYHFDGDIYDGMGIYVRMIAQSDEGTDSLTEFALISDCAWDIRLGETAIKNIIYPNPVGESMYINSPATMSVEIDNLGGLKFYLQKTSDKIDMSNIPKGFYVVRLFNSAGTAIYSQKIIVQ